MKKSRYFKTLTGKNLKYPLFFPDATRAVIKTIDSNDIKDSKIKGVLVNTYHLYAGPGNKVFKKYDGVRNFMSWDGGLITDSGGFQVMSIAKKESKNSITDDGVRFSLIGKKKKQLFTPEMSIKFQMLLKTDMVIVLDDFTDKNATRKKARETVERTILWAKRSKAEFEKQCSRLKIPKEKRPYLLAVVQGGDYLDLRKECAERLIEIGFDGLGYGGWPIKNDGSFNYDVAEIIAETAPKDYILFGLGIGKPHEIVRLSKIGYQIFDCVLPTRDARHKRLYVYNAKSIDSINVNKKNFYSYFTPSYQKHINDPSPVSYACDCLLCKKYSKGYLAHLFKVGDSSALRLSTIHNLRFYSLLMEKLR